VPPRSCYLPTRNRTARGQRATTLRLELWVEVAVAGVKSTWFHDVMDLCLM